MKRMTLIKICFLAIVFFLLVYAAANIKIQKAPPKDKIIIEVKKEPLISIVDRNKYNFATSTFYQVLRHEIGKNWSRKPFCHNPSPKVDPGGFTCGSFSIRARYQFFADTLNNLFKNCIYDFHLPKGAADPFGPTENFCYHFKKEMYVDYYKKFEGCPYTAFAILGDTALNSGPTRAIKILQASHKIAVDGLWGPQSLKACKNFNKKAYLARRLSFLKKLKNWEPNKRGWMKRLQDLDKEYK